MCLIHASSILYRFLLALLGWDACLSKEIA